LKQREEVRLHVGRLVAGDLTDLSHLLSLTEPVLGISKRLPLSQAERRASDIQPSPKSLPHLHPIPVHHPNLPLLPRRPPLDFFLCHTYALIADNSFHTSLPVEILKSHLRFRHGAPQRKYDSRLSCRVSTNCLLTCCSLRRSRGRRVSYG
jgi:hypothetical protein